MPTSTPDDDHHPGSHEHPGGGLSPGCLLQRARRLQPQTDRQHRQIYPARSPSGTTLPSPPSIQHDPARHGRGPGPAAGGQLSGDTFIFTSFLSATNMTWENGPPSAPRSRGRPFSNELTASGNPGMVQTCKATPGCVAYVGVSAESAATAAGLSMAQFQNKSGQYVTPTAGDHYRRRRCRVQQCPGQPGPVAHLRVRRPVVPHRELRVPRGQGDPVQCGDLRGHPDLPGLDHQHQRGKLGGLPGEGQFCGVALDGGSGRQRRHRQDHPVTLPGLPADSMVRDGGPPPPKPGLSGIYADARLQVEAVGQTRPWLSNVLLVAAL